MNAHVTLPAKTAPAAAPPSRFDGVSLGLHWASVVLIVALFASAWSLALAQVGGAAGAILTLHRSLGVSLWILALLRLGWRLGFAVRPALPADMPELQKVAAAITEGALYLLMLAQP
ncbi:cytochrome b/b6 domain-containing protein, partial [Phenylobacterium sp.]|uniref:cytochrome b n=1 Tax=Phenylobacterium sp. TaxID=1871053 RepID=UPI0011F4A804